jgi:hypothetical protein
LLFVPVEYDYILSKNLFLDNIPIDFSKYIIIDQQKNQQNIFNFETKGESLEKVSLFFTDNMIGEICLAYELPLLSVSGDAILMTVPSYTFLYYTAVSDVNAIFNYKSKSTCIYFSHHVTKKAYDLYCEYLDTKASLLYQSSSKSAISTEPISLQEIRNNPDEYNFEIPFSLEELDTYSATLLIAHWSKENDNKNQATPRWATDDFRQKLIDNKHSYHPTSRVFHYVKKSTKQTLNQSLLSSLANASSMPDIDQLHKLFRSSSTLSFDIDIDDDDDLNLGEGIGASLPLPSEIGRILKITSFPANPDQSPTTIYSADDEQHLLDDNEEAEDEDDNDDDDDDYDDFVPDSITVTSTSKGRLPDRIISSNNSLIRSSSVMGDYRTRFLRVHTEARVLKGKLYRARMKCKKLNNQISEKEDLYQNARNHLKTIVAERNSAQKDRQNLQDQLLATKLRKDELEASLVPFQEKVNSQESEIALQNDTIKKLNIELNRVNRSLEDLTKDPEEIIVENTTLKQDLDEANDKIHELQALLSGKTIAFNDITQQLQEANILINGLRNDLMNAGEWIFPDSLPNVVEASKKYYSTRLAFHERVNQTIEAFTPAKSEKRPRIVQEAVKMLKSLADTMYRLKFIDNNLDEKTFTHLTGIPFSMTETKLTNRKSADVKARTCLYNGVKIDFFPHIKSSIQGTELRIHFQFLEDERKILICHIGSHLPTAGTRLNT